VPRGHDAVEAEQLDGAGLLAAWAYAEFRRFGGWLRRCWSQWRASSGVLAPAA
jgi:hypothetical protein